MHKEADHESEGSIEDWQPTNQQRVALTHAFILQQRCLTLGIEWDPRVLRREVVTRQGAANRLRRRVRSSTVIDTGRQASSEQRGMLAPQGWLEPATS
jgi:hypothetical protein